MKRISLLFVLLFFSLSFSSTPVNLKLTPQGYELSVSIENYSLKEDNIFGPRRNATLINESFTNLDIEGYTANGDIGAPEILSRSFEIALENDDISFEVVINRADTIILKNKLYPNQYPLIYSKRFEKREIFAYNPHFYKSFKNAPVIKVQDRFTYRKQKAATILLTPVNYDPQTDRLIIIRDMKIKINTTKPSAVRSGESNHFDKIMRNKFQNLKGKLGRSIPSTQFRANENYLIIATPDYLNNTDLKTLVEYRKNMFNVEIVSTDDIGNTKEQFRNYIRNKMPAYVLLVGNYASFPAHQFTFQFQQVTYIKSVAYYVGSQTSGQPNPDIAMGVFFINSNTQLKNIVEKTIKAEANNLSMPNVFLGQGGNEQQMGSLAPQHCDEVVQQMGEDFFVPNDYEHIEVYSVLSPKGGKNEVINAVNSGVRFINYNGHGFVSGWQYGWKTSDLNSLTNTDFFPSVLSCACLTGTFDQNSIAQAYAYDNNGPSAWIGSYEASSMGQHTLNYGFYEAIMEKDITKIGLAFVYGANATTNPEATKSMPPNITTMQLMQWQYHIFGDPALELIHEVETEPHIKVSFPDGLEELEQYKTYEIKWNSNVEEKVDIKLYKGNIEILTIAENEINDGKYQWQIPENMEPGNNYKIKIACITTDSLQDMSDENFSVIEEFLINEFPYIQNFDSFTSETENLLDKWEQLTDDDIEWTVLAGPTPSRTGIEPDRTGPRTDNTTGTETGNYLYVEASNPNNPGKEAKMKTPNFNLTNLQEAELTFYVHMLSDTSPTQMGDLYLDISFDDNIATEIIHLTDNLGDSWIKQQVDLTEYKGKRVNFTFRGVTGETWCSDICIDDFKIDGNKVNTFNTQGKVQNIYSLNFHQNRILFTIPANLKNKTAVIKLYDLKGKIINSLSLNKFESGTHSITLNKLNNGTSLAAGYYLCRLEKTDFNKTISFIYKK